MDGGINVEGMLTQLTRTHDNAQRAQLEAQYAAALEANPAFILRSLSEALANQDTGVVTLALVLLRRNFTKGEDSPFATLESQTQEVIKDNLLNNLTVSAYGPMRKSAAACVGSLAMLVFSLKQDWNVLWENVFHILGADESGPELKITCCEVIEECGGVMASFFEVHYQAFGAGIQKCFADRSNLASELHSAALSALQSVVSCSEQVCEEMKKLAPSILDLLQQAVVDCNWDAAENYLEVFVEMLSSERNLFEDATLPLLTGLVQMASSYDVQQSVRHISIECILSICEAQPKKIRKIPDFLSSFFTLMFQYTTEPVFSDEWDIKNDTEDFLDDVPDYLVALEALDRLANALGGRKLVKVTEQLFTTNAKSSEWKCRFAAAFLIHQVVEGMRESLDPLLNDIVGYLYTLCDDESKYVRSAAFDALAQIAAEFNEKFIFNSMPMLEKVVSTLHSDPIPHVKASAALTVGLLFNNETEEEDEIEEMESKKKFEAYFAPCADQLIHALIGCLESTQVLYLQESILTALSSLIDMLPNKCVPYVQQLVSGFQNLLLYPDEPQYAGIRNRSLECLTILAAGVGGEVFRPYALSVCEYLKQRCENGLAPDADSRFVLRGWTCMAECLGGDIAPYLPVFLPILLERYSSEDFQLTEEEPADGEEETAFKVIIPGKGTRYVIINDEAMEDKKLSGYILSNMMLTIPDCFEPYFVDIVNASLLVIGNGMEEFVGRAAFILSKVFEHMAEKKMPQIKELALASFDPLVKAIDDETDAETLDSLSSAFSLCVGVSPELVTYEASSGLSEKLLAAFTSADMAMKKLAAAVQKEQDEDEIDILEAKREQCEDTIMALQGCVEALLENCSAVFGASFAHNFFPLFSTWATSKDEVLIRVAYSLMSTFVEYSPQNAIPLIAPIVQQALVIVDNTKDEEHLQACFYFFKVCLVNLPKEESTQQAVASIQSAVMKYLYVPEARTNTFYGHATCNVVSCLAVLLEKFYDSNTPSLQNDLQLFVSFLPTKYDLLEAVDIHDRVLRWIEQGLPQVVNTPDCSSAMVQRLKTADPDTLSDGAKAKLANL